MALKLCLHFLAALALALLPVPFAASRDLAPAPAPHGAALYTSLAVQRTARAEQSSTCFTATGKEKCGGHLAHHYAMTLKAFLALNPSACPTKGTVMPTGTSFCVSSAYTTLQSACTDASGALHYVKKGQTCAELAATGGLTLTALKQLNPHLNCKHPQAGWAVCLQTAHAAINNAAPDGVRRVQQPMEG